MKSWLTVSIAAASMVLLVGSLAASEVSQSSEGLVRRHSGGRVTIDLTWMKPTDLSAAEELAFRVAMNTHSVDLDGYDLTKLAFLRDGQGRLHPAQAWEDPKGGGHHRFGVLVFANRDSQGSLIIGPGSRACEVIIKDVAGVDERSFRWELPGREGV